MTRIPIGAALAVWLVASAASAADRAKADVSCAPTEEPLTYDCTIALANARTGAPLENVDVTVGAEMPSMPMAHNVRPVKATSGQEAGRYLARITLEMHGDWALRLDLSGAMRDRLIETVWFGEPGAMPHDRDEDKMEGHQGNMPHDAAPEK